MNLTHLDLFSGIGGFALAAKWAGIETIQFVEIDPFCQKILKKNFPGVPIHDDIKTFKYTGPTPFILTGGFPCQDISSASKYAKGIDGERSGLWEYLCKAIGIIRPRFALVENVTNLLAGERGRWFATVLRDLAEVGYDAEWHCIPASFIGAPHHRDRVWTLAYPRSQSTTFPILSRNCFKIGGGTKEWCKDWVFFEMVAGVPSRLQRWRKMGQPGLVRENDGIPDVLDRLKALGNAIVPQVAFQIIKGIVDIKEGAA